MSMDSAAENIVDLGQVVAQKQKTLLAELDENLVSWISVYLNLAVGDVRGAARRKNIDLHLQRFRAWYRRRYHHERLSTCLRIDVEAWLKALNAPKPDPQAGELEPFKLKPATVNSHLASLSGLCRWIDAVRPGFFQMGNPCAHVKELPLPAVRANTLTPEQVISLKSVLIRLPALYARHGLRHVQRQRKKNQAPEAQARSRPYRDRAIVELMLSTGVRREELVMLDLTHLELSAGAALTPEALRQARRVKLLDVRGKGKHYRDLFLGADARSALADYLEKERPHDASHFGTPAALFVRAWNAPAHNDPDESREGRLAVNTINYLIKRIGELHDAEQASPERKLGRMHPHRLRHAFGFRLSETTEHKESEIREQLGHHSSRYIGVYTGAPDDVRAGYVEDF